MTSRRNRVCPLELAGSLDNRIRRWLQNPRKIIAPYVKEGMKVMDVGCGPGFFSIEMADMVGRSGKVFSVDLQQGMLDKIGKKIQGTDLEERIQLVKSEQDNIRVPEKVDFILAFYMVHEVPNKVRFLETLKDVMKQDGCFLLVEPKFFHVSKKGFAATVQTAERVGFRVTARPKIGFSFSALLELSQS